MSTLVVPTLVCRRPLRDSIHWAASLGVDGVQLDARTEVTAGQFGESACRQLQQLLGERQLRVDSLIFPLRYPLYETPALDECVAAIRGALELAERLKVRTLVLRPGRIPADDSPHRRQLRDVLSDLSLAGGHRGVRLALTMSADAPQAIRSLLRELPEGLAAFDLDPAGLILNHRSPITALRELHDLLGHVQLRDGRRDEDGTGVETELGQGEVPWAELFALLHEAGYQGGTTIRRTAGESLMEDVVAAVSFARRFMVSISR